MITNKTNRKFGFLLEHRQTRKGPIVFNKSPMGKTACLNSYRVLILFLIAMNCLLIPTSTFGQNFFSKYFKDQQKYSVTVDPTQVQGTLQEGRVYLTEAEVISMALVHNLDINVERHGYLLDQWTVDQHKGIYDPTLNLGFGWDRNKIPSSNVLQGGTSITDVLTSYNAGYLQNFSTGTSFELNFESMRNRTTNLYSRVVPAIDSNFKVIFRQNLLEGFGRVTPDYQIEISLNNRESNEQKFKQNASEIIILVLNAYWELQFALQDIEVKTKSLQLANTVLDQNRSRLEAGMAARLEVVEADAEVASRREELIRSQFNYRRIQDQLIKLITNYQDPRKFPGKIVPARQIYTPSPISNSFEKLQTIAWELRPEIQQAEFAILNKELNLAVSRNHLKPTLDLVAGYRQFGLGGNQRTLDFSQGIGNAQILAIIPGGIGDSFSQLSSGDFYGYTLGLNLELPIFNTDALAKNAKAQLEMDRSFLQKQSILQTISLEIRDALTSIEGNEARLEAGQEAVRFATERLKGEEARFKIGIGTTRQLIEAQRDLLQTTSILLRARIDLIKSHHLLDRALGQTFTKNNILLSETLKTNIN